MKNKFNDIIPPERKRSIRDIPVPDKHIAPRLSRAHTRQHHEEPAEPADNTKAEIFVKTKKAIDEHEESHIPDGYFESLGHIRGKKKSKLPAIIIFFALLIGAGFVLSKTLHSAIVTISPKQSETDLSYSFIAKGKPAPDEIMYDVVNYDTSVSKEVKATGEKTVTTKASGKIIIYNNFSTASQELVANTRFEATNGKIYRISKAVIVPGQKTIDGKLTPGSVEAIVTADVPGEAYNSKETDFTIPGFKGSPKFSGFYARSSTPIEGGSSGIRKVPSDADLSKISKDLESELKAKLIADVSARVPKDFVLIKGAEQFELKQIEIKDSSNKEMALVALSGSIKTYIFQRQDIERNITKKLSDPISQNIEITSYDGLSLASFKENASSSVSANLIGKTTIKAKIDTEKLANAIAGQSKKNIVPIISDFTDIQKAEVVVKPIWMPSLPVDTERIRVIVD